MDCGARYASGATNAGSVRSRRIPARGVADAIEHADGIRQPIMNCPLLFDFGCEVGRTLIARAGGGWLESSNFDLHESSSKVI